MAKLYSILIILLFSSLSKSLGSSYGASNYITNHNAVGLSNIENFSILNPATMLLDSNDYVTFRAKPSKFELSELNQYMITNKLNLSDNFALGFNLSNTGSDLYSEFALEGKIAYQISDIIIIGSSLEYSNLNIKNFNSHNLLELNVGAVLILSDDLIAGFSLRNALRNHLLEFDKTIYQESILGISYLFSPKLAFDIDAIININSYSAVNIGFNYKFTDDFRSKFSVRTYPINYELSSLYQFNDYFALMFGLNYNNILGISPELVIKLNL